MWESARFRSRALRRRKSRAKYRTLKSSPFGARKARIWKASASPVGRAASIKSRLSYSLRVEAASGLVLPEHLNGDGVGAFRVACTIGLEGVSTRRAARRRGRRSFQPGGMIMREVYDPPVIEVARLPAGKVGRDLLPFLNEVVLRWPDLSARDLRGAFVLAKTLGAIAEPGGRA